MSPVDQHRTAFFASSMDDQLLKVPYHAIGRWKRGLVRAIDLTRRDLEYLLALFTFGALTTDMLHAIVCPALAQRVTTDRMFLLKNPPNGYALQPEAQQRARNSNCAHLAYEISRKGAEALVDHDRIGHEDLVLWTKLQANFRPQHFDHDLATGHALASIRLGARQARLRYLSWRDILNRPRCPAEARAAANPFEIPCAPDSKQSVVPDALFGLEYPDGACFFALEIDMGTEQHKESDLKQATIVRKLKAYRLALRNESHRARFSLPSLQVLIVTAGAVRMRNMMQHLRAIAAQDGCGPTHAFLFKAIPQLASISGKRLPPTGHMLANAWDRVDHPQLNLCEL